MKNLKLAVFIIIISISLISCSNSKGLNNNKITIDEAKEIALKHAGLANEQVSFLKAEKDIDNGRELYNIEFYYNNEEYDYEINSANGEIISYDHDIENNNINNNINNNNVNNSSNSNIDSKANISKEEAQKIALEHAGLTSNQVKFKRGKVDFDNGIKVYEIEFYYNNKEYSYEINATTGQILSYEQG